MNLPPYYLRRVCRENPDLAFQSGVKWYINLGKLAAYYNNKNGAIGIMASAKLMIPKRSAPYYVLTANVTVHGKGCGDMGALTLTPLY